MPRAKTRHEKSTPEGCYLYAVVPMEVVDSLDLDTPGIQGADVYPVTSGKLAAIVSDIEQQTLRPERKLLSTHSAVLGRVMDQAPMLPVAFGIIAGSEREVRNLLAEHENDFLTQLDAVSGNVELGLRIRLIDPNAFEYYVNAFPELRAMRDDLYREGEPSREEKIELGKQFVDLLNGFREETADKVLDGIESIASQTVVNEPRNESEVVNLAALVPRKKVDAFNATVEKLGATLPDDFQVDVTGPWPPYSFINLRIHFEQVEEAAQGAP
ncbi:GvpL/GvpF family gas vesicle protein [Myxococcus stipitatus]|uniref:GvpL/GvpF family gas vesicle protein n=1 Tax=Myxococcus stipitatus TaxID=83455 RepID=UPI001F458FDE|nr:GvpL/GvpF family gas vesicle protein [Myxococcus stipitatus]MCE9670117.1 GvpL/GvpF family gas vesicle protein [Myxococcus stipitatus]